MSNPPGDRDAMAALRALANRWAMLARDHARDAKNQTAAGDIASSNYHRGIAEAYYRAATDLAEIVKQVQSGQLTDTSMTARTTGTVPAAPVEPNVPYARVAIGEVMSMLEYAGVTARDVKQHKDNAFTAIFSRWQPFSETERLDRIKRADQRIVILTTGKLPDTGDPYVDFAFKESVS